MSSGNNHGFLLKISTQNFKIVFDKKKPFIFRVIINEIYSKGHLQSGSRRPRMCMGQLAYLSNDERDIDFAFWTRWIAAKNDFA